MASKLISYDPQTDTFNFGNESDVTDKVIRHKIAETLRATRWSGGREVVDFLFVRVTVQYLHQMLDFVDEHGWFWDNFDIATGDHDFDWNRITPGRAWGDAQELKQVARQTLDAAQWLDEEGYHRLASGQVKIANQMFREANRLIVTDGGYQS